MRLRRPAFVVILAVLAAVIGCIQYRQGVELLPDGSGKIRVTLTVPLKVAEKAETPRTVYADAAGDCEGFVAFTDASVTVADGKQTAAFTGWFEDANSVKLQRRKKTALRMRWTRDGGEYTLEVVLGLVEDLAKKALAQAEKTAKAEKSDAKEIDRELLEMAKRIQKEMFEGLDIQTEVRLPGRIRSVEGFEKVDERTVRFRLRGKEMGDIEAMRRVTKLKFRVRCDASLATDAEVKSFRKALSAAKKAWSKNPAGRTVRVEEVSSFPSTGGGFLRVLGGARTLLAADSDKQNTPVTLYDAKGKQVARFPTVDTYVTDVFLSRDRPHLHVLAATDGHLSTFDIGTGDLLWETRSPVVDGEAEYWEAYAGPFGNVVVGKEHGIDVHEGRTGTPLLSCPGKDRKYLLRTTPIENGVLVSEQDVSRFALVDLATGKRLWTVPASFDGKTEVEGDPVIAKNAYVAGEDRALLLACCDLGFDLSAHELETGKELWRLRLPRVGVFPSPSGRLAIARGRERVWLIDVMAGKLLGRIEGLPERMVDMAFGSEDDTVWVATNARSKATFRRFRLHIPESE